MHRVEITLEQTHQVNHRIRALDGARNRIGLAHIDRDELRLAEAAERLEEQRLARIALGDSHPRAGRKQFLRDVATEKSSAADQRNQPVLHACVPCLS